MPPHEFIFTSETLVIYIRKVESFVKIICLLQFIILPLEAFVLKHLKCLFISFNNHVLFKTFFGSMDQY